MLTTSEVEVELASRQAT